MNTPMNTRTTSYPQRLRTRASAATATAIHPSTRSRRISGVRQLDRIVETPGRLAASILSRACVFGMVCGLLIIVTLLQTAFGIGHGQALRVHPGRRTARRSLLMAAFAFTPIAWLIARREERAAARRRRRAAPQP